jgi:hypothetical protein
MHTLSVTYGKGFQELSWIDADNLEKGKLKTRLGVKAFLAIYAD